MRSLFGFLAAVLFAAAPAGAAMRMSAWVPAWDPAALDAMRLHAGKLTETNPGWYAMGTDGSVVANWGAENVDMRAALTGTALVPTIKNNNGGKFDGAAVATVLGSEVTRTAHVNAIVDLVVQKAYSGIDVDYERVPATSRADFTAFVRQLADQLHRQGAILSVTVYAKTSDADNWNGPGAQDWVAIGQAADSVKVMAYDYHWSTSAAGALSPLGWLDSIAAYGESVIPAGKLVIGLPWYGYDWVGTSATGVTYASATSTAAANGAAVTHDENGEATYAYGTHVVYFQDAKSYKTKVDYLLARHAGIAGFAHWRVGAEDPAIWTAVESLKLGGTTSGSSPARSTGDFGLAGGAPLSIPPGASGSAVISLNPVNGFSGAASLSVHAPSGFNGTLTLSSSVISAASSVLVTIAANSAATPGTYLIEVAAATDAVVRTRTIEVTVPADRNTGTTAAPIGKRRSSGR